MSLTWQHTDTASGTGPGLQGRRTLALVPIRLEGGAIVLDTSRTILLVPSPRRVVVYPHPARARRARLRREVLKTAALVGLFFGLLLAAGCAPSIGTAPAVLEEPCTDLSTGCHPQWEIDNWYGDSTLTDVEQEHEAGL